ncbi:MAG TPA: CoA-binding protein [Longimicrobiales bacterium]|nr:CoA-binding protein [Longimicrobiales bacterium]
MADVTPYHPDDDGLRRIYEESRTIAVVGLSGKPERDSHRVASYLQRHGYRIIPVNPKEEQVLGERSYDSLSEIPEPVDVVDVFRRAEHTPPIAKEAVDIGAKVLWLQEGIVNDEAREIAEEGGLQVVMGICMMVTHRRLGIGS